MVMAIVTCLRMISSICGAVVVLLTVGCSTHYSIDNVDGEQKVYRVDDQGGKTLVYATDLQGKTTVYDANDPMAKRQVA
jgi:hypothetical protein